MSRIDSAMARVAAASKVAMILAVAFFFVTAGVLMHKMEIESGQLAAQAGTALVSVNAVAVKASTTVDAINDPHKGTLKIFNEDLGSAKSLIIHADLAARTAQQAASSEVAYLDEWNIQVTDTFKGVNRTLGLADSSLTTTSRNANVAIVHATGLINAATVTTNSTNKLVSDRSLPKTLANLAVGTKAAAASAVDVQQYVHSALHPTWPHRIYSLLTGLGVDTAKVFIP